MNLKAEHIFLRAIEPSDIELIYEWENDIENWIVSNTQTPFSRFVLEQYITSAHEDIYTAKQLRLIICTNDNKYGQTFKKQNGWGWNDVIINSVRT